MTRAEKDEIRKLSQAGLGSRAIGRRVGFSHVHVQRVLRESQPPADKESDLADLAAAVTSFGLEFSSGKWKVVNYELKLGAKKETAAHSSAAAAIREAAQLWA